jgi:DNA-directed RNA polymerase subunit RPC12/RpoP
MEGKRMGQVSVFKIDLNRIEGNGEFPCPSCGAPISPDDESEATYEIINVKTREDGSLKTLSILCKKCRSKILIEGFEALNQFKDLDESDKL